ncbi:MAG: peptidylprolyl isomerase [Planctomycetota bacterium]|jgi:cyclophilin family peptidyl-prolyl cis-trans isomerase
MNHGMLGICALLAPLLVSTHLATAQDDLSAIVATLGSGSHYVLPGRPIWVDFTLTNTSDQPVELTVPETGSLPSVGLVGLPLSHVFSGPGFSGLAIHGEHGKSWSAAVGYQPPASAERLVLGPHASVGIGVEVTQYYRVLRAPGRFRLQWNPYGGAITSNSLVIEVAAPKQALIQTDDGTLVVRFFYEEAPNHIANFLDLARAGFYDNLTFHRIIPGYYIQGGCPNGDGTGIRPDGIKLDAEVSDRPMQRGTVCMARLEDDLGSASCQFLICNTRVPQWDGKYTVFGELFGEESLATLDKLMAAETTPGGAPKKRLYMRAVRVVDAPVEPSP